MTYVSTIGFFILAIASMLAAYITLQRDKACGFDNAPFALIIFVFSLCQLCYIGGYATFNKGAKPEDVAALFIIASSLSAIALGKMDSLIELIWGADNYRLEGTFKMYCAKFGLMAFCAGVGLAIVLSLIFNVYMVRI